MSQPFDAILRMIWSIRDQGAVGVSVDAQGRGTMAR
jgi:hypothetical protein